MPDSQLYLQLSQLSSRSNFCFTRRPFNEKLTLVYQTLDNVAVSGVSGEGLNAVQIGSQTAQSDGDAIM